MKRNEKKAFNATKTIHIHTTNKRKQIRTDTSRREKRCSSRFTFSSNQLLSLSLVAKKKQQQISLVAFLMQYIYISKK